MVRTAYAPHHFGSMEDDMNTSVHRKQTGNTRNTVLLVALHDAKPEYLMSEPKKFFFFFFKKS